MIRIGTLTYFVSINSSLNYFNYLYSRSSSLVEVSRYVRDSSCKTPPGLDYNARLVSDVKIKR